VEEHADQSASNSIRTGFPPLGSARPKTGGPPANGRARPERGSAVPGARRNSRQSLFAADRAATAGLAPGPPPLAEALD